MLSLNLEKKPYEVREYFKFKGQINMWAFLALQKENPRIAFEPHKGQLEILKAYEERATSRFSELDFEYAYNVLVAACGRRFGKSEIAAEIGAAELMIPYARVLICSYRLDNCEVIFNKIYKILKQFSLEMVRESKKDMEIELVNGATLKVASNDNVEAKLGNPVSLLILDEAKLFSRKLYEQVLKPMLFDYYPYSRTLLISSPQQGWFEDYYNYGNKDHPSYRDLHWSINLPTHTNPAVPREVLEDAKKNDPPDVYAQEVLGLFVASTGQVAKEFIPKVHILNSEEWLPRIKEWVKTNNIINSIDSGFSHYFASVWMVHVAEIDTLIIFDEYQVNGTITDVHAQNIKAVEASWGLNFETIEYRFADPAAKQQIADLTAFDLYYNGSEKPFQPTILTLNTQLYRESELGMRKLMVLDSCEETIRQLMGVKWKEDTSGLTTEKNKQATKPFQKDSERKTDWDIFDALRYGVYNFRGSEDVGLTILEQFEEELDRNTDEYFLQQMMIAGYVKVS